MQTWPDVPLLCVLYPKTSATDQALTLVMQPLMSAEVLVGLDF